MTDRKKNPGALGGASRPGKPIQCSTDSGSKVARPKHCVTLRVTPYDPQLASVTKTFCGRALWALNRLAEAGVRGCTPITEPAPRWAAYVHALRGLGVPIETINEEHEGDFPGMHARYVLRASVTLKAAGGAPDGETV